MFDSNPNGYSQKMVIIIIVQDGLVSEVQICVKCVSQRNENEIVAKNMFPQINPHSGSYSRSVIVAIATHKHFLVANPHQGHPFIKRRSNLAK